MASASVGLCMLGQACGSGIVQRAGDSLPGLGSMGLTQRRNRAPRARVTPGIARSSIRPDRRSRLADHCRRSVEPRILWLVPLACLCAVGLSPAEVPRQISLALTAFVRLRTVLPVTLGGFRITSSAWEPWPRHGWRGHHAPAVSRGGTCRPAGGHPRDGARPGRTTARKAERTSSRLSPDQTQAGITIRDCSLVAG